MKDFRLLSIGLLWLAGCSTTSPFAATTQQPVPLGPQIANNSSAAPGSPTPSFGAGSQQQFTQTSPNTYRQGANPANPFLAGLRSTTASISNALTIEPRVITAASGSPSLSNDPMTIGADLNFKAAQVYESQQNIPGAISHFQKALEQSPGDPRVLTGFGRMYDRQGDLQRAHGLYQQALQTDPNNCAALNAMGICYAKQGNLDGALAHLSRAAQLDPQNVRYKNNLASVLADAGRIDEAYAHLVSGHGEAGAHYNLGYLLLHQGKPNEARNQLVLALQANPYMDQARSLLASLEPESGLVQPANVGFEAPRRLSISPPTNQHTVDPRGIMPRAGLPSYEQAPLARPVNFPTR